VGEKIPADDDTNPSVPAHAPVSWLPFLLPFPRNQVHLYEKFRLELKAADSTPQATTPPAAHTHTHNTNAHLGSQNFKYQ